MTLPGIQSELPVACNLDAGAAVARKQETSDQLFSQVHEIIELDDGYAYRFPGDDEVLKKLSQFVQEERHCCPFLTFELVFEPAHGQITMSLRGPDGTRAFLEEMFGGVNGV